MTAAEGILAVLCVGLMLRNRQLKRQRDEAYLLHLRNVERECLPEEHRLRLH